jgi:hypothetical protein
MGLGKPQAGIAHASQALEQARRRCVRRQAGVSVNPAPIAMVLKSSYKIIYTSLCKKILYMAEVAERNVELILFGYLLPSERLGGAMPDEGLTADSVALGNQVQALAKTRLGCRRGRLPAEALAALDRDLLIALFAWATDAISGHRQDGGLVRS